MPDISVNAPGGGSFTAHVALPNKPNAPALLVIQEIFGVNHVMRDLCARYAEAGYLAICPDLFWRQQPGIQITDKTDAEWQRAFELYQGFDEAKGVDDLRATLDAIRADDRCTGKVGTVGYCLGGKLAYLMATRSNADCSVGYYGVGIENSLAEANNITAPLLLHVAEQDEYCPAPAQHQINDALASAPKVTIHAYPGMNHAFARIGGAHYDQSAAEQANTRTAAFFAQHLGGAA